MSIAQDDMYDYLKNGRLDCKELKILFYLNPLIDRAL